jgi:hypothetical protein
MKTHSFGAYSVVVSFVPRGSNATWHAHLGHQDLPFLVAFPPSSVRLADLQVQKPLGASALAVPSPGLDEVLVQDPSVDHARGRNAAYPQDEEFERRSCFYVYR